MKAVFDIESDGFLYDVGESQREVTKVFCIAIQEIETGDRYLFEPHQIEDGLEQLKKYDTLIGHNILGYDLPVLEKLYNFKYNGTVIDTLVLSRLAYPFAASHSLEAWGNFLGYPKIDYNNFDYYEMDMAIYCQQDVKVNEKLYRHIIKKIDPMEEYVRLEHDIQSIQTQSEIYGVSFDYDEAMKLLTKITVEMEDIQEKAKEVLGYKYETYTTKLKKDGTPNIHAEKKIKQGFKYEIKEGLCFVEIPTEITLDTKSLLLERLLELGWNPTMYTEKGTPQVAVKGEACPNLSNIEGLADIGKYFVLKHRKALLEGLFKVVRKDGKIPSEANTLGAVTGRYTHRKIANFPAVRSLYGLEIRSLFGVDEGRVQVGCDLAGIEARMLAHYMNDASYTSEVLDGDIHTANQIAAGLPTRDAAKTFFYGFLYGAGDAKVGTLVNGTSEDGRKVKEKFLENLPALDRLITKKQKEAEQGYVISLDGRPVYITKSERFGKTVYDTRKALNTLLQSSATIFFKKWVWFIDKLTKEKQLDAKLMISYHDEGQWSVAQDDVENFKAVLYTALKFTDAYYKVKCRNDIDIKTGNNWGDCH